MPNQDEFLQHERDRIADEHIQRELDRIADSPEASFWADHETDYRKQVLGKFPEAEVTQTPRDLDYTLMDDEQPVPNVEGCMWDVVCYVIAIVAFSATMAWYFSTLP